MSDAVATPQTAGTPAPTAPAGLPYDDVIPGAVVGRWAEETEPALFVAPDKLLALLTHLRDNEGYDFLSSVTCTDYLTYKGKLRAGIKERFDVVYHLYSTSKGGGPIVLHVRVPDDETVPSATGIYPSASLQEREVYDLYGIKFAGHPNLRRILLWEGFQGHPMRKDWKEAYFDEEAKPFKNRHPGGHYIWHEDKLPWKSNSTYPDGWDPESWREPVTYVPVSQAPEHHYGDIDTQSIVVNLGPHHPSTHGVFRMLTRMEGETVLALEPEVGYLHRNHEKIGERNTWLMNMPFTDRLDYINSMSNNFAYALAVEKLLGLEVPERAQYIRVIMAEFTRVINHFWLVGFVLNDLGALQTPALYGIEEREMILDLFEEVSGSRLMCNYFRFGGVVRDLTPGWLDRAKYLVHDRLPRAWDMIDELLKENEIVKARGRGVGYLPAKDLIALGVSGPLIRAAGVPYDIRKAEPYSIYDRFNFDVPTLPESDIYSRFYIRMLEIRESLKILRQALRDIPEGEVLGGKGGYTFRPPEGEAYARVEAPKGELGFYLVSDNKPNPYRYHVRAPSFINITALGPMSVGYKIADAVVILGAIDIVLGELDR
jgi:NADH-quinone oxidoreductase subunit D/NADH-quinone oxidoreductase subunit C/D